METPGFVADWGILTKEWFVAAWTAATVDWIASKVPVQPGIIGTLLSTAQLAAVVSIVSGLTGLLGKKTASEFITDNWFLYNVIWSMSPTATMRLMSGYTKFHRILYGTSPLPRPATGPACADGKCAEHKLDK